MPKTETCHFWVGKMSKKIAGQYFVESIDESDEGARISQFARDQGVTYYDHDFLEYGWGKADSIEELVVNYSYSDQWSAELARRVAASKLEGVNFFSFITASEIKRPRSVEGDGYWLKYMGTISYKI